MCQTSSAYITDLFGTPTFKNENCIHTFHQVEFMPPLVHKDRVQKTVLYLKLKVGFCAVSRKTNVLQTSKHFASADPQKGLSSCLLLISALKLTQLVELRRKAARFLVGVIGFNLTAPPRAQIAYSMMNASTVEAKVKAEHIALQHVLSFDRTAYSLWIGLSEQTVPSCLRMKHDPYWHNTNAFDLISSSEIFMPQVLQTLGYRSFV